MREAFSKAATPNAKWYFPMNIQYLRTMLEKDLVELEENGPQGKVHFLEIHDYNVPTLVKLRRLLAQWRNMTATQNISYFAFSVIREPISFQMSYFNYYHIQRKRPEYKPRNATQEDFFQSVKSNPQCTYLSRGEAAWQDGMYGSRIGRRPFKQKHCDIAIAALYKHMDWVGTTERLQDTLELVSNLTRVPLKTTTSSKIHNPSRKHLKLSDLNDTAIEHLKNITTMDQALYEMVQRDWNIEEWRELQLRERYGEPLP